MCRRAQLAWLISTALYACGVSAQNNIPPVDMAVEWINHKSSPIQGGKTWARIEEVSPEGETLQWQVLKHDKTLSQTLFRWAQTAGWQIQWDAERDFPIEAHMDVQATFVEALKMVMESLADSEYPLQVVLNPGMRSLRVVRHNEGPRR